MARISSGSSLTVKPCGIDIPPSNWEPMRRSLEAFRRVVARVAYMLYIEVDLERQLSLGAIALDICRTLDLTHQF